MPSSASQSSNASCARRDLRRHDRMLPGGRRVSAALSPSGVDRFTVKSGTADSSVSGGPTGSDRAPSKMAQHVRAASQRTAVSAGIGLSRARNHVVHGLVVEMVVGQWKWLWGKGLPEPFSLRKPSIFGLNKPDSGGGGWVRTSDTGLMSSWLPGLSMAGAIRL